MGKSENFAQLLGENRCPVHRRIAAGRGVQSFFLSES
jgi:hypothetical protein